MKYDPKKHHRRSVRLKGYDYKQTAAYFVTVVTQDRQCLFGEIRDGDMRLNDAGFMVRAAWTALSHYYPGVDLDLSVVMPNHVHGVIVLVGAGPRACPKPIWPPPDRTAGKGQPQGVAPTLGLPDVVHRFKTLTTRRYVDGVRGLGWLPFRDRLWQRNYHEHIIRDEDSLDRIRQYIQNNPARWLFDRENLAAITPEPKDAWRSHRFPAKTPSVG
jgi:REP element-mobilizing transposase RayT